MTHTLKPYTRPVVLAAMAATLAGGPSLALTQAVGAPDLQANKAAVVAFYNEALNDKNPTGALQYLGPRYIQHNPNAENGPEGFVKYITFIRDHFPRSHSEIMAVFAEGDFVILHVRTRREPDQRGNAIAEFFRLENGEIVEHWDVIQPIPDTDLNGHGMF